MALFRKLKDLSGFDNKLIMLDNAELILTRKCNLACEHCMRGNPENVLMTQEVMEQFFARCSKTMTD